MSETQSWREWLSHLDCENLLELPETVMAQPWRPGDADRKAAWSLYTEIRTRITTQPLHFRAGDEETALTSLFALFAITRKLIGDGGPECRHFATLAVFVLNQIVRPTTARWHKRTIDDRLAHDDDRRQFRRELKRVQARLRRFASLLGHLAEGDQFQPGSESGFVADDEVAGLGADIPFDTLLPPGVDGLADVHAAERAAVAARRGGDDPTNLFGLACSGGGIRSATVCLGVVQRLARANLLKDVDFLSTVSGGGYFGAFLSSTLNDSSAAIGTARDRLPFHEPALPEPAAVRHLRNNSRYLLKGGLRSRVNVVRLLLQGMLAHVVSLVPLVAAALAIAGLVQLAGTYWHLTVSWAQVLSVLLAGFGALALLALFARRYAAANRLRDVLDRAAVYVLLLAAAVAGLGIAGPWLYGLLVQLTNGTGLAVVVAMALLPLALAAAAMRVGAARPVGRVLLALVGVTGPLFLYVLFLYLNNSVFNAHVAQHWMWLAASTVPFVLYLWLANVNWLSIHPYYRDRIAEAWVLRRTAEGEVEHDVPAKLSGLRSQDGSAPIHLIGAAVNVPASEDDNLRGRNADFFVFSQYFCGSPIVGYCATGDLETADPDLDLATAVAISGAAAASHMGTKTPAGASFWMALLNLRLGYWLPNPTRVNGQANAEKWRGPNPLYFLFEAFGRLDEKRRYVNVSDGGHIENLGLIELLRRRCKFVIAIDAEADPDMQFSGLITAIRFARIDLDVDVRIDLGDLRPAAAGNSRAHFALGTIEYPGDGTGGAAPRGLLLYIKSSLTGNERDYIQDYRRTHPTFPHESTADQFFDESQFEAYRALGEHMADDLFQEDLVQAAVGDVPAFFQALVTNLHEPTQRGAGDAAGAGAVQA